MSTDMKLVGTDKLDGIYAMFETVARGRDYGLSGYHACYAKYLGCGHRLLVLVNEGDHDKITEIGSKKIAASEMAKLMAEVVSDFKIVVMLDAEIDCMSVWDRNGVVNSEAVYVI